MCAGRYKKPADTHIFYMSYLANKATVSAFTDELKFEKSGKGRK